MRKIKKTEHAFLFFFNALTGFGKLTEIFTWVWKVMILPYCFDVQTIDFRVVIEVMQLSSRWHDIGDENTKHIYISKEP
jgi:hypothetical protein